MPTQNTIALIAACAAIASAPVATAQPVVPEGFSARNIAPLLDGQIPQLSAIDDPSGFGTGVVTAVVANGIANVRLISPSGVLSTIGVWNQAPNNSIIRRVRFDSDGLIDGLVHAAVSDDSGNDTHYLTLTAQGGVTQQWERTDRVQHDFAFSGGGAGNPAGVTLFDFYMPGGTELAWMDAAFAVTVTNEDSNPPNRTDTDIRGFQVDETGLYGGGFLMADTDLNNDAESAIYELRDVLTGGTYRAIYGPVSTGVKRYGDLAVAVAGDFGGVLYVTETLTSEIQQVATDGTHTPWATGFIGLDSLSISPDGTTMYAGDLNGVWIIRAEGNEPGPVILATDPSTPSSSDLTGGPVDSFRFVFSEPVLFTDGDITITDGEGNPVGFDASGSASQFMLIGLAEPLSADSYTVTIADTVTSVISGEPLDGDGDGFSGGDAVRTFAHRCLADVAEAEGILDLSDITAFVESFVSGCP